MVALALRLKKYESKILGTVTMLTRSEMNGPAAFATLCVVFWHQFCHSSVTYVRRSTFFNMVQHMAWRAKLMRIAQELDHLGCVVAQPLQFAFGKGQVVLLLL